MLRALCSGTAVLLLISSLHSASALPSSTLAHLLFERADLTADSTCQDLSNYQSDNHVSLQGDFWDKTSTSDLLSSWCDGNSDGCSNNFASAFAEPWGLGQSFSCELNTPCDRPDCSNLQDVNAKQSAAAYEVLVSLSNVNQYLVYLRGALNQGKDRFDGLSTALQQHLWPSHSADDLMLGEIMNGASAAMGMIAAIAGGPMAGIAKEMVNGMLNGVYRAMTSKDESLANLAAMETETDTWYQGCLNSVNSLNDDLMTKGVHDSTNVQDLIAGGAWLDYREHPVLNTDASKPRVTEQQLNDLVSIRLRAKGVQR
jgi:hypothetical protein